MKPVQLFVLFLGMLTQAIRAQNDTQALPACAVSCLDTYIPQSSCLPTDQQCICSDKILQANLTACVEVGCTVREGLEACNWPIHDKQPLIREVTIPFLVIATLFYLARITARLSIFGGEFGPDDYMMTAAYIVTFALNLTLFLLASAGLGKDIWQVPSTVSDDKITLTLQLFTAFEKEYILAIWFTKMSVLLLYLRIFQDAKFRIKVNLALAFSAATAFCLFFACLFKCWPISFGWTYWDGEHHGSCSSQNAQGWANAGLNIFGDLLVLSLPLPIIWKMSLSRGKRLGMTFMFGCGIIITIISLARLYTLEDFTLSVNPTWDDVNLSIWSVVEVNISVMCANFPGTRNFYNRVICGRILGTGPFAPGASRTGSPTSLRRQMSENSSQWPQRTISSTSDRSDATSFDKHQFVLPREIVVSLNDKDGEGRNASPMFDTRSWNQYHPHSIEEWPIVLKH